MMMKVENIQSAKIIPEKQQPQLLKQGEFIMSEVMELKGDTALLRTAQGTLLMARLLGDLGLKAGDHVETVVDEAGLGRYVLRLVDISRGGQMAPDIGQAMAPAAQNLKNQTLYSALSMLKKNAGLEPKTAEFMAKNGIAASPENIETLSRLAGGTPRVAQAIIQMNSEAASLKTGLENMAAATVPTSMRGTEMPAVILRPATNAGMAQGAFKTQSMAETTQVAVQSATAQSADTSVPGGTVSAATVPAQTPAQGLPVMAALPETTVQQIIKDIMPKTDTESPVLSTKTGEQPAGASAPEASSGTLVGISSEAAAGKAAGSPPAIVDNRIAPAVELPAAPEKTQPATIKTSAQPAEPERIQQPNIALTAGQLRTTVQPDHAQEPVVLLQRLMSLFVDMKDRETMPAQLKKAAHEMPSQLKELKISLQTTDNSDRNTMAQRAENLDRQFSLMSEIKRFDCYHVPLTNANGTPSTAELYVYRQRRRKADEQPDSFAVLLGLDTQNMGRVEAMIKASGRSVALDFKLEQADLADEFAEGARQLEPLITQTGYRLSGVSISELDMRTTVLNAEEVLSEGQASDTGGLDIRI
jgi:hypothetical protein